MTWTQGQPSRTNQPPFTEPESQESVNQPPVSRAYTRSNDRRPDYRGRQPQPSKPNMRPNDIAATFTQEGLQTFSSIFSSAVEAAIARSLPGIVERSVEHKLAQVAQQLRLEMTEQITQLAKSMAESLQPAFEVQMHQVLQEALEKPVPATGLVESDSNQQVVEGEKETEESCHEKNPQHTTRLGTGRATAVDIEEETPDEEASRDRAKDRADMLPRRRTRTHDETVIVIETLKRLGRPVRTSELPELMENVNWGSNPSAKITNLMNRSNGQILRTGRGVYEYQGFEEQQE